MDPYLEAHCPDVHTALIAELRGALNRVLPSDLVARAEERIAVESADDDRPRRYAADVGVLDSQPGQPWGDGPVAIRAPFVLEVERDPLVERSVHVVDDRGRLVTVLELVSPANKRPPGLSVFRDKRRELLAGGVHVVEIDLVRAGDWPTLMRPEICPPAARSTYRVAIRTGRRPPGAYLFPIRLGEPLPVIPIPLRVTDAIVEVALQPLLDRVYADGRYASTLDYSRRLEPQLEPEDAVRVEELLGAR